MGRWRSDRPPPRLPGPVLANALHNALGIWLGDLPSVPGARAGGAGGGDVRSFTLHEPQTVNEAVAELRSHGAEARPLAGGTDLVAGVMRDQLSGSAMPTRHNLVDLTTVPELTGIHIENGSARIGCHHDAAGDRRLAGADRTLAPLLAQAGGARSPRPENRALGTLAQLSTQRSRCWFLPQQGLRCIKKGGDICFAVKATTGTTPSSAATCVHVHPRTWPWAGGAGRPGPRRLPAQESLREVPFAEYFLGPRRPVARDGPGSGRALTEVVIPPAGSRPPHPRLAETQRQGGSRPGTSRSLSVAAAITAIDGVLGGRPDRCWRVAPTPYRATAVEEALAAQDIRSRPPRRDPGTRRWPARCATTRSSSNWRKRWIERTVLGALASDR